MSTPDQEYLTPPIPCPVLHDLCDCESCPVCGAPYRHYRPGCPVCALCEYDVEELAAAEDEI